MGRVNRAYNAPVQSGVSESAKHAKHFGVTLEGRAS